jgi:poly-beta-1,6-N-acetyl-D-glucosamine N-deacetylase
VSRLALFARNLICTVLAAVLIACGRVRRARKVALSRSVVTALYFHKPKAKLFLRCIQWLIEHGHTFISAADLKAFLYHQSSLPPGAVWLSFDDGCRELLENVLPVVERYNIPVTLFIPSGIVAGDGRFPWVKNGARGRHAITVEELQMLAEYPEVTLGSHTVSHADLRCCAPEQLERELRDSKRMLEAWTGRTVDCLAYPYCVFDERATSAVQAARYALVVTAENAFVTADSVPYLVPRFSIADAIWFPEMICNIVGVWRPALDPLKKFVQRISCGLAAGRQVMTRSSTAQVPVPDSTCQKPAKHDYGF